MAVARLSGLAPPAAESRVRRGLGESLGVARQFALCVLSELSQGGRRNQDPGPRVRPGGRCGWSEPSSRPSRSARSWSRQRSPRACACTSSARWSSSIEAWPTTPSEASSMDPRGRPDLAGSVPSTRTASASPIPRATFVGVAARRKKSWAPVSSMGATSISTTSRRHSTEHGRNRLTPRASRSLCARSGGSLSESIQAKASVRHHCIER
jgi:hypothetical protein